MMGYWAHGDNVFDVSTSSHIKYILDHLSSFGLTEEDVRRAYAETGERFGTEGKARELLIKYAATHGWIRVRHYQRPRDFWSIQCDNTNSQQGALKRFCKWAIKHGLMDDSSEVTFLGYSNPQDSMTFYFTSGGIGKFLMEKKTTNMKRSN